MTQDYAQYLQDMAEMPLYFQVFFVNEKQMPMFWQNDGGWGSAVDAKIMPESEANAIIDRFHHLDLKKLG
jgi:hypothetical protein